MKHAVVVVTQPKPGSAEQRTLWQRTMSELPKTATQAADQNTAIWLLDVATETLEIAKIVALANSQGYPHKVHYFSECPTTYSWPGP